MKSLRPSQETIIGGASEIAANEAASLRDFGDGVAVFEIHRKMNTIVPEVLDVLEDALELAGRRYRALVITGADRRAFSAGADLNFFAGVIKSGRFAFLKSYVHRGQQVLLKMKYCDVPVVAAVHGVALGAGCELMLHANAVMAHAAARIGLPEANVGVIPGWGGCTQTLVRAQERAGTGEPMAAAAAAFALLRHAFVSTSALDAQERGLLRPTDRIVADGDGLLPAAAALALEMALNYEPPAKTLISVVGSPGCDELMSGAQDVATTESAEGIDDGLAYRIAWIVTGGDGAARGRLVGEEDLMRLECEAAVAQAQTARTRERVVGFLERSKQLGG